MIIFVSFIFIRKLYIGIENLVLKTIFDIFFVPFLLQKNTTIDVLNNCAQRVLNNDNLSLKLKCLYNVNRYLSRLKICCLIVLIEGFYALNFLINIVSNKKNRHFESFKMPIYCFFETNKLLFLINRIDCVFSVFIYDIVNLGLNIM
jgi:hypothetical protein